MDGEFDYDNAWQDHGHYILRLCCKLLQDLPAAEDIRQEVFTSLMGAADKKEISQETIRSWLHRVAYNKCMIFWREQKRKWDNQGALTRHYSDMQAAECAAPVWEVLETPALIQASQVLSPETAQLLKLSFADGYTHDEIAHLMGLRRGTVSKRIKRGLELLRQIYAGEPENPDPDPTLQPEK
jgi:RNA polymerase sigma-70 factor (ECF subfamily)